MNGDGQERGGRNRVPSGGRPSNRRMNRSSSRSSGRGDAPSAGTKRWMPKSSPSNSKVSETGTVKGHSSGEAQISGAMDDTPSSVKGLTLCGTLHQTPEATDALLEDSEGALNPSPASTSHHPQSSSVGPEEPILQSSPFTSQGLEKQNDLDKVIPDQKDPHECPTTEGQNVELAPEASDECLAKGPPPTLGPSLGEKNRGTLTTKEGQNGELAPEVFDICLGKAPSLALNPSSLHMNREKRKTPDAKFLRSGMVILEKYLSLSDQVKIVKKCRELGVGEAGFYIPGYEEGGKLHLRMMCMGKNWVPGDGSYGDRRPEDGAKPPPIPAAFSDLVRKALEVSNALIAKREGGEESIPRMTPDICIVNFYTASGRLGLHRDKDESPDSLRKGLPVVSFSIGDTAVFLYSDKRDVEKAHTVELESGDVLIFGGKSRHVFHGVSQITSHSAPPTLVRDARLRPGRLNLTFRQY